MTARSFPGWDLPDVLVHVGVPLDDAHESCVRPIGLTSTPAGYWRISFDCQPWNLHRLILKHLLGEIPAGVQARHTCGNKWCVNPRHIAGGTIRDNMRDQYALGERVMNESHPQCRLSTADARAIRDDTTTPAGVLAVRHGITAKYVRQIQSGKRRQYLDDVPVKTYRALARAT